jgi:hypothetical protein
MYFFFYRRPPSTNTHTKANIKKSSFLVLPDAHTPSIRQPLRNVLDLRLTVELASPNSRSHAMVGAEHRWLDDRPQRANPRELYDSVLKIYFQPFRSWGYLPDDHLSMTI